MTFEESLHDVTIRERQLEAHILRSAEYLRLANRDLRRQLLLLYVAIALLAMFLAYCLFHASAELPFAFNLNSLITATSLLGIINCFLLIQTKTWLRRLNEAWLKPEEKSAIESLKAQRQEILTRLPRSRDASSENAELN